ncbi:nucleotidyl transferase AbiEii/AbiGii toxin family protein [Fodinicurvata sediminis]|uniref:nucleotidyl transferase AbiEii/AbiGii toxin family protein n=1 Tax=Fodinicurvata sediminis TaxID=1121832 RepID=UPI0003B3CF30|nr:nucleotidyl transferase AbiEii/AbiGii toxin family protein [Fodinicurvata sediminis]
MSDLDPEERAPTPDIVDVDVRAWVETARTDPTLYRDRQVTEIVLAAIGLTPSLHDTLVLKGGAVMALAFKSSRVTADVDFTATVEPADLADRIGEDLNAVLPRTATRLGYLDLLCRVQTVKKMPRPQDFEDHSFPALLVRVGSAKRGTGEEQKLENGKAPRVLDLEISFRDQVHAFQELNLTGANVAVRAFTLHEVIAEKLRALLQQTIRNRNRRQDIYDISYLVEGQNLDDEARRIILTTLIEKCRSRRITPTTESMDDPEVYRRAEQDWESLALELGDLPPFEERFAVVRGFYLSLPWQALT